MQGQFFLKKQTAALARNSLPDESWTRQRSGVCLLVSRRLPRKRRRPKNLRVQWVNSPAFHVKFAALGARSDHQAAASPAFKGEALQARRAFDQQRRRKCVGFGRRWKHNSSEQGAAHRLAPARVEHVTVDPAIRLERLAPNCRTS